MANSYARPVLVSDQGLFVLQSHRIEANSTHDEKWLQDLIDRHPECLPIIEIEPALEGAISVCREMPTTNGPIDNVLLTPHGDIILVETKLWKNPEARRTVVAQALDYAACVFELDYQSFEVAILKAQTKQPINRLYDLFEGKSEKDEVSFIDAVEANLRRGRALILVVGDGIRSQTRQLAELVQSHAGARFTFALVELAIFKMPGSEQVLVCPRTLVQTELLERGVIRIEDGRALSIAAPERLTSPSGFKPMPESITSEQFMDAMAGINPQLPQKLKQVLEQLQDVGVAAQFQRSLHLRWETPSGKSVSLGYISRSGEIWTDTVTNGVPTALAQDYVKELADALGAKFFVSEKGIVDDMTKASASSAERLKAIDMFQTTLLSRLNDKKNGVVIVVAQRTHTDDLPGFLLTQPSWTHLNLQAIAPADSIIAIGESTFHRRKKDDVLHPEREDFATLEELRKSIGDATFAAQYLQAPGAPQGAVFPSRWFARYETPYPLRRYDYRIFVIDTAFTPATTSDYSVCSIFGVWGENSDLLHVWRDRIDFDGLVSEVSELMHEYKPSHVFIEMSANGRPLYDVLRKRFQRGLHPITPHISKEDRAARVQPYLQQRKIRLPKAAPWLSAWCAEVFAFPSVMYDDQADTLVYFASYAEKGFRIKAAIEWFRTPPPGRLFSYS